MTFEQQWDAAAYNVPYWVSSATMIVLPLLAAGLITYRYRGHARARLAVHVIAAFVCFLLTAWLTAEAIDLKWQLRRQAARTEAEQRIVADRDSANLAFAPIIGGFCGAIAAVLEGSTAFVGGRLQGRRSGFINRD